MLPNGILDWGSANVVDDPVLNHPAMQRLRWVKQLGQVDGVNSRAVHTRYDHSCFAAYIGGHICSILNSKGRLPSSERDLVQLIKLHDYGHPPFSHAVEYVLREHTPTDHKQRALLLLDSDEHDNHGHTLADVLEMTGTNIANLRRLLEGKNHAGTICTDKTLGADKLAYTSMDAFVCGYNQMPPAWQSLVPFITFLEHLGLDVGMRVRQQDDPISMVCAMQTFYFRMYSDVYLSPESLALERHIQKAVELSIAAGILVPKTIWELGDGALVHCIEVAPLKNEKVNEAQSQLSRYTQAGDVYQRAVAFIFERFLHNQYPDEKAHPLDEVFKTDFLAAFNKPSRLSALEETLSRQIGIPFICSLLPDPEKMKPADVPLYVGARHVHNLREYRPMHYKMLDEHAESFFAIRLLVPKQEQDNARRKHHQVAGAFYEIAKDLMRDAA